jgi:hypothetical protein
VQCFLKGGAYMKHVDELKKAVTKGQSTSFLIPPKLGSGECESLKCVEASALNWCNYVCIYLKLSTLHPSCSPRRSSKLIALLVE